MNSIDAEDRDWSCEWLVRTLGVQAGALEKLELLIANLATENERQNLVANGTLPFSWSRHIVDSLQLLAHVPRETSRTWLDLGTGAGFPGLACAVVSQTVQFTLVEQRPLRTQWLHRQVEALELANVDVKTVNIAALPIAPFDVISARAFAPLSRLLKLSAAFSTPATQWVLPKGRSATQELNELKGWRHTFHVEQSVTDPQSGIITGKLLGRS